jgi:hypothetical protein
MLIIVDYWLMFLDKELHAFILEGWKENELGTCDSERMASKEKEF